MRKLTACWPHLAVNRSGERSREMSDGGAGEKNFDGQQNIQRAIIVAGPSCVGKTTLMKRLGQGDLPALQQQLGMGSPKDWVFCPARKWSESIFENGRNVVLHYDFLRLINAGIQSYGDDEVLAGLSAMENLTVLTLWQTADILLKRCRKRHWKNLHNLRKGRFSHYVKQRKRLNRKCQLFQSPDAVRHWYKRWFDFCATLPMADHYILENQCNVKPVTYIESVVGA